MTKDRFSLQLLDKYGFEYVYEIFEASEMIFL